MRREAPAGGDGSVARGVWTVKVRVGLARGFERRSLARGLGGWPHGNAVAVGDVLEKAVDEGEAREMAAGRRP